MNELLIKQYINRLTHQDIDAFAKQYGLVLKKMKLKSFMIVLKIIGGLYYMEIQEMF